MSKLINAVNEQNRVIINKEIIIHSVINEDLPTVDMHTHGLDKYGWPELKVFDIPAFLKNITGGLMNAIADWLINGIKKLPKDDSIENHYVIIDNFFGEGLDTEPIEFLLDEDKKSMLFYSVPICSSCKK